MSAVSGQAGAHPPTTHELTIRALTLTAFLELQRFLVLRALYWTRAMQA